MSTFSFNDYQQAMEFLYSTLPYFTRDGAKAIKPGLDNIINFCNYLGNPQHSFKCIHIAGTNGKGSTSHGLAAILQQAGYKTGLYTSPHLKSFTERIRINGFSIPEIEVTAFVQEHQGYIEEHKPSFFETTFALCLDYFAKQNIDIAVIETGVGGRLDSTNILSPILSHITNISWDHADLLGDSLEKIAFEKAGIIKPNTPVTIAEKQADSIAQVFINKALEEQAPLTFAVDAVQVKALHSSNMAVEYGAEVKGVGKFSFQSNLIGDYQIANFQGIIASALQLQKLGLSISWEDIFEALPNITSLTGLKGRWQIVNEKPLAIADTGHNEAGLRSNFEQLAKLKPKNLHIVFGLMADKDFSKIQAILPKENTFYYPSVPKLPRAMAYEQLINNLKSLDLTIIPTTGDINEAYKLALQNADLDDVIYIGGSTFVVAELDCL